MKTIAALLPPLAAGSGGLRTVLNLLGGLARHGCECHVYVEGDATELELRQSLRKDFQCDWVIPHPDWNIGTEHDLVLATMWHTAIVLAAARGSFKKAYLVQDYEPFFYPMGTHHLLAEFSYQQQLNVITMGRWLAEKLRADFGLTARPLDFCADARVYSPRPEGVLPEFALAFVYQPEKAHRAPLICVEALQQVQRVLPALRIYTFGSPHQPPHLRTSHLGIVSPEQLNDVYRRCLAGLCVSMSNPSRIPFEMLAAGLPVVEAHRENNLLDLPAGGAVLANLDSISIKEALLDLVADASLRETTRRAGLEFMTWRTAEAEQEQFCAHIFDILAGRPPKRQSLPVPDRGPYRRAIAAPTECDLLTVDVWDTLLRRKCHPDEIKLFTAHYLELTRWTSLKPSCRSIFQLLKERIECERAIGMQRQAKGLDDEYSAREVFCSWLATVFAVPPPPDELAKIADELVAVECAQERRCVYADPRIQQLLDTIPARRRMFLSDFYLPAAQIKDLLRDVARKGGTGDSPVPSGDPPLGMGVASVAESAAILKQASLNLPPGQRPGGAGDSPVPPDWDGVVSCDVSLNKRSGRLFRHLQQQCQVPAARHLHIGDNELSDYVVPRTLGMSAFHYLDRAETGKSEIFKKEFTLRTAHFDKRAPQPEPSARKKKQTVAEDKWKKTFCPAELLAATALHNEDLDALDESQAMFRYGQAMAPLFVTFAQFVAEEAIKAGLPRLYFCTREGEFFARVYEALGQTDPLGVPFPQPVILEVSRMATFAASLSRFDGVEFMRLWNLYSSQSLRGFFASLDLDPAPVAALIASCDLTLDEVLRHPWLDMRMKKLLAEGQFIQFLTQASARKRALLLDYLKEKGIQGAEAKIGLVDIGWRGTIQDNLCWVLPNTKVHGWYFGLLPFLNVQPPNAVKASFGPGRAGDPPAALRLLEYVAPLEMLSNSESGSALRYVRQGQTTVAEREHNPHEEEVFRRWTRHFQAGVLDQIGRMAGVLRERALGALELRALSFELLARVVHDPPKAVAEAYFSLNHNETFGTGAFDDKQRHRSRLAQVRRLYDTGALEEFETELRATSWPQGFARLCGVEYPFFGRDNRYPRELPLPQRRAARQLGLEALQLFRENKLEPAKRAALRALAIDPWRIKLHYLIYRIGVEQNRTKEALHRFGLIRELHPTHAPSYNEFACRAFAAGVTDKGRTILQDLVEDREEYRPAILNLCRIHLQQGKYLKALAVLDLGVDACGDHPDFLRFRALAQSFAGEALLREAGDLRDRLPKDLPLELPLLDQHDFIRQHAPAFASKLAEFTRLDSDDEYLGVKPGARLAVAAPPAAALAEGRPPALASVVVLACNQLEHTRRCLESLFAHTRAPFELILVDNGSTDGTPAYFADLRKKHDYVRVITNVSNRGFAAGNNQALAIARGEVVVLLNNDTVVAVGWLDALTAVLARHPDVGIVGPMSNRVSGPQWVPHVPYQDLADLPAFAAQWAESHRGQSFATNRAVGFCLLMSRAVVEALGGLDEQFGSGNFEDDDLCVRARLGGFGIRIAQEVFIHHTGSQTFQGELIDYRQAMLRNWDLFRAKWKLPSDVSLERGYPLPTALPEGVSLHVPLPSLGLTHKADGDNSWFEPAAVRPVPTRQDASAVACLGNLDDARSLFGRRQLPEAWNAATASIHVRPFHPEAWLLLAEIALAAGDAASARVCAQRARELAPQWTAARQFLQKSIKGNAHPDWLVLPKTSGPRLSVCLITRNEEQFIGRCLESIRGLADEIILVDTGSTDRTVEIAQSHGAQVHHFVWCDDFSAARNVALEHATAEWILILDADEELPADQHGPLCADLKRADGLAYRLPLVNHGQEAEGQSYLPRLFRNAPGAFYHGRIHEQVFTSLIPLTCSLGLEIKLGTARLLHHGYTQDLIKDRNKIERNLRLLRQAVQEAPHEPNIVMNLGLELVRSGDLKAGLVHYRDAFRLMSAQPAREVVPELREVLLTQLTSHLYKIRAHQEVAQVLASPLAKSVGLTASLHFALGLSQFELKHYREAAEQMRQCLVKRNQPCLSPINTDILTAAPCHCQALALARLGDPVGAEKAFFAGMAETGRTDDLRVDYAKFLAAQDRAVDGLRRLHEVITHSPTLLSAWTTGGEIALSRPEFLEFARDWTSEAVRHFPDHAALAALRAESLLLSGATAAALPLWQDACAQVRSPRSLAALILCAAVELQDPPVPFNEAEEAAASRAFVELYRRLVAFGARETVMTLNSRIEEVRGSLPGAARLLEHVVAQTSQTEPLAAVAG